jgi:hypothetical protein
LFSRESGEGEKIMEDSPANSFLARLDVVERRLLRERDPRVGALTAPDAKTGERWDVGQMWAHLAEILPYWIEQARKVIDAHSAEPVPFGRVKSDAGRIAAIERDRTASSVLLRERVRTHIAELRTFLQERTDDDWSARGLHEARGIMDLPRIVDEFMVGHLEEHADSLDDLER